MTEYSFSKRGEYFEGRFSTKAEAIKQALASYKDIETVYIGKVEEPVLTWNSNEDYITESIYEGLYDQCGEAAECFEVTEEQELALGKMIDEAVKAWIDKEKIAPSCWRVVDIEEVDIEEWRLDNTPDLTP